MNLAEYSSCDGVALANLVRRGETSPKELAALFMEAVEKVNPRINAIIEVYSDRVKGTGDQAVFTGPYAGVPFLMKDIGAHEAGRRQESGSRLMKGFVRRQRFVIDRASQKCWFKLDGSNHNA